MSQNEAATTLGVNSRVYARLEQGLATALTAEDLAGLLAALGPLRPTMGEFCFVARRRSGMDMNSLTAALGVSRPWFYKLEFGADNTMVNYWEGRGFRFPTEHERGILSKF